jgi:hypothetical protein
MKVLLKTVNAFLIIKFQKIKKLVIIIIII